MSRYPTRDRATGFWGAEVALPAAVFTAAGVRVDYASPKGGAVPLDPSSDPHDPNSFGKDDPETRAFLDSAEQRAKLAATLSLENVDLGAYDAVLFAGGSGAAFDFPTDAGVQRTVRLMFERGKVVAAICHGNAALVPARLAGGAYLVSQKSTTGFSNAEEKMSGNLDGALPFSIEDEMKAHGASYSSAAPWQSHVVRDRNLITAQQPQSARALAVEMLRALRGS